MQQGVLVGTDRNQEWLLPWWWAHYSHQNNFPVAFIDFGMTAPSKNWCRERGQLIPFSMKMPPISKKKILQETQILWESHYGKKIWSRRKIWFKKPFALLLSPFTHSIWLDLDVQVQKNLAPFFNCLFACEVALKRDAEEIQELHRKRKYIGPDEVNYDCGCIAFKQNAAFLLRWTEEIKKRHFQYVFDQQALAKAIVSHFELPEIFNWSGAKGMNPNAYVIHHHGGYLKEMIKRQGMPH